jgi:hypothetical protein
MGKGTASHEFNPERYGMMYCPGCLGAGKHPEDENEGLVCHVCGGFGWIKRENRTPLAISGIPVRYGAPPY